MDTTTPLDAYFAVSLVVLLPAIITLILSGVATFISKESTFTNTKDDLLGKLLDKKVAMLRTLFDSVEFVAESLGAVKEFKGKQFFLEVDKYTALERKTKGCAKMHSWCVSSFHYGIALALILAMLSFIKFPAGLLVAITIFTFVLLVYMALCIFLMRRSETKVATILAMDELRYEDA